MGFEFSAISLNRIFECHPDLQTIAFELIKEMDITVLCGHRDEMAQNDAFINGKSRLPWPRSKHNSLPSLAIDLAPYPICWNDLPSFLLMCSKIERIAKTLNINIRLGRDFSFKDFPHIELK